MTFKRFLGILAAALLLLAPLLDGWLAREVIERSLTAAGARRVELATAFLNPFTGELAIDDLRVLGGEGEESALRRLRMEIAWAPLAERRLVLRATRIEGLRLTLADTPAGWRVGGLTPPPASPNDGDGDAAPWRMAAGVLTLSDVELRLRRGNDERALRVRHALAAGFAGLDAERPTVVEMDGSLDGAPLRLSGRALPAARRFEGELSARGLPLAPLSGGALTDGRGALDGRLTLTLADGVELDHRGALTLTELTIPLEGRDQRAERLAWRGEARLRYRDDTTRILLDGSLEGGGLAATLPDPTSSTLERLDWKGSLELSLAHDAPPRIAAEGRLEGERFAATTADGHRLNQRRVAWNGRFGMEGERPTVAGDLRAEGVRLEREATTLFAGDTLALGGVSVEGRRGAASTITAEGITLLRGPSERPATAELGSVSAQRLAYSADGGIELATAKLDRLRLRLTRGPATDAPAAATPPADGDHTLPLRIGRLELSGDSHLDFEDRTLSPPHRFQLAMERLVLTELDGRAPRKPVGIELAATLGDYTRIESRGTLTPFTQPPDLRLDGRLDALDLPPLSPYTAEALGYNLSSGQMDAEFEVKLERGALAGEGRIIAHNLQVEAVDPDRMAAMNKEMEIPLESALSLLRDDRGDVHLNLPVSGSLDDPRFDLGDAINQAVGKAMRAAAVGYLKLTLQPFGALITLVEVAGKAAAQVRLAPLPFAAGEAALPTDAAVYLDKIDALLQQRPGLRLRLCGYAGPDDREALNEAMRARAKGMGDGKQEKETSSTELGDETLLELATARAEAIKRYLTGERGRDPKRLFLCLPKLEEKGEGRVELTI